MTEATETAEGYTALMLPVLEDGSLLRVRTFGPVVKLFIKTGERSWAQLSPRDLERRAAHIAPLMEALERLLNAAESQVELMRVGNWRRSRDCPHGTAAPGRFCDKCSDWLEAAYDDAREAWLAAQEAAP